MVRLRFVSLIVAGLLGAFVLTGCFGTPFDKGDGSGVGTGRPARDQIDQGKTGGLGSPRGQEMIAPGELGPRETNAPGTGAR